MVQTIEMETAYRVMFKGYPDILNAEEVGKMLGIGRKQVYKLIQNGRLQKIPCGRAVKVAKTNVINYVLQCAQENT